MRLLTRNVMLGSVTSPKLRFWYHICVHIDLNNATISAAVNGQGFSPQSNIHVFLLDPFHRRGRVYKWKFFLFVCLSVCPSSLFPSSNIQ